MRRCEIVERSFRRWRVLQQIWMTRARNTVASTFSNVGVMLVDGSSSNQVVYNEVEDNMLEGIHVSGSDGNRLKGNTVIRNQEVGIHLVGSSGSIVVSNRVMHNGLEGISLTDGSGSNSVTWNLACRNDSYDAFDDGGASGNVWTANRFCTSSI